jgi:hypothetical protein
VAIETFFRHPKVHIGREGSLVVVVALSAPTNDSFNQMHDQFEQAIQRHGRITMCSVIPRYDGPMKVDAHVRKARAEQMGRLAPQIVGEAMVVQAGGLGGTIIRTVLTSISLLVTNRAPNKVFASVEDAVPWLKGLPGQTAALTSDPFLAKSISQYTAEAMAGAARAASGT